MKMGTLFDAYARHDHVSVLINLIVKNSDIKDEVKREAEELARFSMFPLTKLPYTAPSSSVKKFLKRNGIKDNNTLEALADYEHLESQGELRVPEKWD